MVICSVCGKVHAEGTRNCDLCGAPLAGADRGSSAAPQSLPVAIANGAAQASGPICPICGRANRSISVFCAFCGYRLSAANANGNGPNPYVLPNTNNPHPQSISAPRNGHQPPTPIPAGEAGSIPSNTLLKRRYRVLRKIAQGGMGAVYECTDTVGSTGTRWAVKEMSPAALPAAERTQAIADFRREAQMLASLQHPNLPTVVETFEEFGKNFLVMEFVPGRTLQNVLDNTPGFLPEERVRVWARQLFDVMAYLHSQEPPVVYRDLKPANVMLLEGTERIKLIDFGIARFHKLGKSRDTEAFGTAGYAPPEQYGKGQTDQRSDIYALGATLHYLVTKHDPGLNPFSWLPVRQYNPALSAQLDMALQTALSLDPYKRFSDMVSFAAALGINVGVRDQVVVSTPAPAPAYTPAPALAPVSAPVFTPMPPPAPRNSRQRISTSKPSGTTQTKPKASAAPVKPKFAPVLPVPMAPSIAPMAPVAPRPGLAPVAVASAAAAVAVPVKPQVVETPPPTQPAHDGMTDRTAPSTSIEQDGNAPALVVSDHLVDLGDATWNRKPVRKISLLNVGGGEMKGTILPTQPWVALNIQSFQGNTQTIEVRVKKRSLPFGRLELHVPNLFAIIWTRMRWALPFMIFWFWVLFLAASSIGKQLLMGFVALAGALVLLEVLMWWWAIHVRLLVPTEKLNLGRLLVKSSGGEQQIEVRVKARPSWLRKAVGWTVAALLMAAQLAVAVWIVLTLFGYEIVLW